MKNARFDSIREYREVEAFSIGFEPNNEFVFLQMKMEDDDFLNVVVLTRADALLLAAHLTTVSAAIAADKGEIDLFAPPAADAEGGV